MRPDDEAFSTDVVPVWRSIVTLELEMYCIRPGAGVVRVGAFEYNLGAVSALDILM